MSGSQIDHLLIVDDDEDLRPFLTDYFTDNGFEVSAVPDGKTMWDHIAGYGVPNLIVLDIKLPDARGLDLMKELRTQYSVPIVLLTGEKEEVDRVLGLEMGADDYIAKPFSARELLARIRAILRRIREVEDRISTDTATTGNNVFHIGSWTLDALSRRLSDENGEQVTLPSGEFSILYALVSQPGTVLSREKLLELSRQDNEEIFDRSVDVQIHRIRHKIEKDPSRPQLILTERGKGYVFAGDDN